MVTHRPQALFQSLMVKSLLNRNYFKFQKKSSFGGEGHANCLVCLCWKRCEKFQDAAWGGVSTHPLSASCLHIAQLTIRNVHLALTTMALDKSYMEISIHFEHTSYERSTFHSTCGASAVFGIPI